MEPRKNHNNAGPDFRRIDFEELEIIYKHDPRVLNLIHAYQDLAETGDIRVAKAARQKFQDKIEQLKNGYQAEVDQLKSDLATAHADAVRGQAELAVKKTEYAAHLRQIAAEHEEDRADMQNQLDQEKKLVEILEARLGETEGDLACAEAQVDELREQENKELKRLKTLVEFHGLDEGQS